MIYGTLVGEDSYRSLFLNPAWKLAFEWLRSVGAQTPLGIQQLQGDEIYANVMRYRTVSPDESRYESHRRYVDLQYCISGGELIEWQLSSRLVVAGDYTPDTDLQFYKGVPSKSIVYLEPGAFGIFFPSDAHRPKIHDGTHPDVFKLVVKVAHHLVSTP